MCCNGSNGLDNLDLLKHTEAHHRQNFWHLVCLGVLADFNSEKTSTSATAWVLQGDKSWYLTDTASPLLDQLS